jgi:hypothetical protein
LTKLVLAVLLLSDRWLENTKIELVDNFRIESDVAETMKAQISQYEREDAEELMRQRTRAAEGGRIRVARTLYSQANRIVSPTTNLSGRGRNPSSGVATVPSKKGFF